MNYHAKLLPISHYTQAHRMEECAECYAHYPHLSDTPETASTISIGSRLTPTVDIDFDTMLQDRNRHTVMLNALNRSIGVADTYPFML